jgi:hypothetical protein
MRTVLNEIHLLIDNLIMHGKVYIGNQTEWGEKTAEREKERDRETERR